MASRSRVALAPLREEGSRATPAAAAGERRPARSPARSLGAALAVGTGAGALAGGVLALWTAALNGWAWSLDALCLAGYFGLLYAALTAGALLLMVAAGIALGRRPGPRACGAAAAGLYVLYGGVQRYHPAVQFLTPTSHLSVIGLIDLVALLGCGALIGGAVAARSRRRALARAAAAGLLLVALDRLNVWHERPRVRDLASEVPAALAASFVAPLSPAPVAFERARLVVLGLDGLSWDALLPMLSEGALPGFRALLDGAAYGYLETFPETPLPPSRYSRLTHTESISPSVWETMSTGQAPDRHGIDYFNYPVFPGVSRQVRHLPALYRGNSPMGLRWLLAATHHLAPWDLHPFDARDARVARFFEVAMRHGISVGSYRWRNTGPVPPALGFMVGWGQAEPRMFPADLEEGLAELPGDTPLRPDSVEDIARRAPIERELFGRFLRAAERIPTEVLLYYTHFHDASNHNQWRLETAGRSFFISGWRQPDFVPGRATRLTLEVLDAAVADVLARMPPQALVVVVSDHGFDWREYKHHNGPPGLLIVRGPGVRGGVFGGATVFDLAPSLLHWLGLPVADDMAGAPLPVAEPGGPLDRPAERVATYGPAADVAIASEADPQELERAEEYLRSLGYVN